MFPSDEILAGTLPEVRLELCNIKSNNFHQSEALMSIGGSFLMEGFEFGGNC